MVNLVMDTTREPVRERSMATTRGPLRNGSGYNAGTTSGDHAGARVATTRGTGFCFPSGYHAGDTSGDEQELVSRFLAAIGFDQR